VVAGNMAKGAGTFKINLIFMTLNLSIPASSRVGGIITVFGWHTSQRWTTIQTIINKYIMSLEIPFTFFVIYVWANFCDCITENPSEMLV
jgi:hypothetical protein